jgi:uncharacterized repeat protein (TIGR03803 family)
MSRNRYVFGTALLCGLLTLPLARASDVRGRVLYRFQGGSDGATPLASMIADKAGNLYGTTNLGGGGSSCPSGCGTVFELSPPTGPGGGWIETVLYRFQGGNDGAYPEASLVADQAGNLYGTTSAGGDGDCSVLNSAGCGTVFELAPPSAPGAAWTETVLYSFQGVPSGRGRGDLAGPNGLAFDNAGNLFGLAYSGGRCRTDETGTYCYGGAYELEKPSLPGGGWTEQLIHIFAGPTGGPAGPIFDQAGNLYGTVVWGKYGFGEVFRLEPPASGTSWDKVSVYDFQGPDGAFPEPGLAFDRDGNLYGATLGSPGYGSPYGDVFQLQPTRKGPWSESLLYDFNPYSAGNSPNGGVILGANRHLYGTASEGGEFGSGVVFELTPPGTLSGAWKYEVLYNFGSGDGSPQFGLTFGKGSALYGTTPSGGNPACSNNGYGQGCGTVFKVLP